MDQETLAYTIPDFCKAHHLSRSYYYTLPPEMRPREMRLGRKRLADKYASRIIDIDLLLYDARVLSTEDFQLPHPQLETEAFVLYPLLQLAPDLVHPSTAKPLQESLDRLDWNPNSFKEVPKAEISP